VEKFGSVPITRDEVIQELLSEVHAQLGKERPLERLVSELQRHRASGKRIVFTNGCFDLIHLGHVKYFQFRQGAGRSAGRWREHRHEHPAPQGEQAADHQRG
jgi:D-beta-D-heptose 7-phosphate kinase/D-beta-D-heptose 1-phosphate adenosyltransferase